MGQEEGWAGEGCPQLVLASGQEVLMSARICRSTPWASSRGFCTSSVVGKGRRGRAMKWGARCEGSRRDQREPPRPLPPQRFPNPFQA